MDVAGTGIANWQMLHKRCTNTVTLYGSGHNLIDMPAKL